MFRIAQYILVICINICFAVQNTDSSLVTASIDKINNNKKSICGIDLINSADDSRFYDSVVIFKNPDELLNSLCETEKDSARIIRWNDTLEQQEVTIVDCKDYYLKKTFEINSCKENQDGQEWVKWISSYNGKIWTSTKYSNNMGYSEATVQWNSKGLNGKLETAGITAEYLNGKLNGWITDQRLSEDGDSIMYRFKFDKGILKYFIKVVTDDDGNLIMEGKCSKNICRLKFIDRLAGLTIIRPTKVICNEKRPYSCEVKLHGLQTALMKGRVLKSECYKNGEIFPESECK